MDVAFKGVYTISNIAVSAGNDPGPVTEGHVSNLFEFAPSDRLACTFLISASMVDRCGRRYVSRQRAQQRITEMVHFGKPTMLNDDSIRIQVTERRQWGSERVDMVESDGDSNHCKGQLERGDREIFSQGRDPAGPLLGRQQHRFWQADSQISEFRDHTTQQVEIVLDI
jgi:hypothetical protein